jgi:hypothetical protein
MAAIATLHLGLTFPWINDEPPAVRYRWCLTGGAGHGRSGRRLGDR